jgi:N6-L-threonylcarbamoyladenine synthase
MSIILGIESTAHTFGAGVVRNGKVLSNVRDMYSTEKGGIIPVESAKHHVLVAEGIFLRALEEAKICEEDIDAIAFSQGPGLSPCLLEGMKFVKHLCKKLNVSLIPVNHCVAHLEIGKITGAKDPVLLYVSGANTQVIAYASGKYRIFGETLDLGVGNFIDTFARYLGLGFPGGPKVEKLALESKNYIELPYTVKGMDIALSGILTNLRQKIERLRSPSAHNLLASNQTSSRFSEKKRLMEKKSEGFVSDIKNFRENRAKRDNLTSYTKNDLAFSMQETVFAMLIEVAERALAHTGKKELVLGGGVACNSRLQEMCRIMCKERGTKLFCPEKPLLVDNGAMIAYLGEIMFKSGIKFKGKEIDKIDIKPRQRTDEVSVGWR